MQVSILFKKGAGRPSEVNDAVLTAWRIAQHLRPTSLSSRYFGCEGIPENWDASLVCTTNTPNRLKKFKANLAEAFPGVTINNPSDELFEIQLA